MRGDERVHAGDVGVDLAPLRIGRGLPRRLRRAAEADRAQKAILRDCRAAEDFGEATVADAALEFHLPQAVLCVHVAEAEQRVHLARGEDVGNGVCVANDLESSERGR